MAKEEFEPHAGVTEPQIILEEALDQKYPYLLRQKTRPLYLHIDQSLYTGCPWERKGTMSKDAVFREGKHLTRVSVKSIQTPGPAGGNVQVSPVGESE